MSSACPIRRSIGELLTHLHLWTILLTESPIDEVKAAIVEPFFKSNFQRREESPGILMSDLQVSHTLS